MTDIPNRIHKTLIETIVKGLADKPLVVKGGTSLMLAYGLDRYSEDIDYDSNTKVDLPAAVDTIMRNQTRMEYAIKTKKHTDTTSRIFVNYSTEKVKDATLKIETKNNRELSIDDIHDEPGFLVYTIDKICQHKLQSSLQRIKARDLYDLGFIARHYAHKLTDNNLNKLNKLANNKSIHALYEKQWDKDDFVKHKLFKTTIEALGSVKAYIQKKETEYDMEI